MKGLWRVCYAVDSSGLMDKAMAVEPFAYARHEVRLLSFSVLLRPERCLKPFVSTKSKRFLGLGGRCVVNHHEEEFRVCNL